jgi:hypothetical protein
MALIVGLPAGTAASRWAWSFVARSVGSVSPSVIPFGSLALVVPISVVVLLFAAAGPGWSAAQVAPAKTIQRD